MCIQIFLCFCDPVHAPKFLYREGAPLRPNANGGRLRRQVFRHGTLSRRLAELGDEHLYEAR